MGANNATPTTCDLGITGCEINVDKDGKTTWGCSKSDWCSSGSTRTDATTFYKKTGLTKCCYFGELSNDASKRCLSQYPDFSDSFGETTAASMFVTGMLLVVGKLFF